MQAPNNGRAGVATVLVVAMLAACTPLTPAGSPTAPAKSSTPTAQTPAATASPTSAGASPSLPPGTVLALQPLDRAAFAYEVPGFSAPPLDGDALAALAIAPGPAGWVIGGGYSLSERDNEPLPSEDAVAWFSPDGLDWQRVDTADVFGGPDYQVIRQVAGDATGWWALGESRSGPIDERIVERRLWRSESGVEWRQVVASCAEPADCAGAAAGATVDVQAIKSTWPSGSATEAGAVAAGRVGGTLGVFRLHGDGTVRSIATLPIPSWVDRPASVVARGITVGPDGWLIEGWEFVRGHVVLEPRTLAWTSPDGSTWTPLGEQDTAALADLGPRSVVATPYGWFALGESLHRSVDLSTWTLIQELCCGSEFQALVVHGSMLVALSDDDVRVQTSLDGIAWSPVALTDPMFEDDKLSSGAHPLTGASDGTQLIFAGRDWPGAAAWLGLTP